MQNIFREGVDICVDIENRYIYMREKNCKISIENNAITLIIQHKTKKLKNRKTVHTIITNVFFVEEKQVSCSMFGARCETLIYKLSLRYNLFQRLKTIR